MDELEKMKDGYAFAIGFVLKTLKDKGITPDAVKYVYEKGIDKDRTRKVYGNLFSDCEEIIEWAESL